MRIEYRPSDADRFSAARPFVLVVREGYIGARGRRLGVQELRLTREEVIALALDAEVVLSATKA